MKYDIALVVGRFQPYHNSHHKLLTHALTLGNKVVVALGSAKSAPDVKNPFTPEMREQMIRDCFDEATNERLAFYGVRDYPYNDYNWISEIQNIVNTEQESLIELPEGQDALHNIKLGEHNVALIGYEKDASSYYLKLFPQWKFEPFYDNTKESRMINATDIRNDYLSIGQKYRIQNVSGLISQEIDKSEVLKNWVSLVPAPVVAFLQNFSNTEEYQNLVKDFEYLTRYKEDSKFVGLPFPATFITTDAVVTCKGHILVVRRGANPGKGLLALPGGFLAEGVTLKDNAIKELKEETRINLPAPLLKGLIKDQEVFDHPNRSLRGRTVTHAFYIDINVKVEEGLPLIRGGDDADKAMWLPIAALGENENRFFEDHVHIIRHFLGVA